MQNVERSANYATVRLHSLRLTGERDKDVTQAIRAIKERNIRTICFRFPSVNPEERFEQTIDFITDGRDHIPNQFQAGSADVFEPIQPALYVKIATLVAGILFSFLALESIFQHRLLAYVGSAGMLAFM